MVGESGKSGMEIGERGSQWVVSILRIGKRRNPQLRLVIRETEREYSLVWLRSFGFQV